ncbi:hypothetical protein GCM10009751_13920 [Myceligenerans crystallogenes]|uniref:Uncharacterized protein n=1 Tax=Myceligenerans crystallogenes TaxID=316335 RepID=A0ABN2N9Q0_9MICO
MLVSVLPRRDGPSRELCADRRDTTRWYPVAAPGDAPAQTLGGAGPAVLQDPANRVQAPR